ncbi:MAG: hypothetical protein JOZ57_13060 [Abitibacteriaceae bacterium]|nr:hypothetical protein [Abditibacteriaceae bacterium]
MTPLPVTGPEGSDKIALPATTKVEQPNQSLHPTATISVWIALRLAQRLP